MLPTLDSNVQFLDDSALEAELMEARYAAEQIELAEGEQAEREAFMVWANEQNVAAEADQIRERQMREALALLAAEFPADHPVVIRREQTCRRWEDGKVLWETTHVASAHLPGSLHGMVAFGSGADPMAAAVAAVENWRRSQQKPAA